MRDDAQEMIRIIEQRGADEQHAIRIFQYNANKSRNKVLAGLIEDPRRKNCEGLPGVYLLRNGRCSRKQ